MSQEKIELYKIRDFGAKMGATIDYIRANFLMLIKLVILIIVPIALVFGILTSSFMGGMMNLTEQPVMDDEQFTGFFGSFISGYFFMILIALITYSIMLSSVYYYMKLRDRSDEKPTLSDVYNKAFSRVPGAVLLMIIISFIILAGTLLFVLPGIYLAVVLSLALPIYLFENTGIGEALSKSFVLIKGKWWSTFGLLVVSSVMASFISYIFILPAYALMIGNMFTQLSDPAADPESIKSIFTSWYTSAGMTFAMIGTYLTYIIPIIALAFQYFNLSERVEGSGIKKEIEGFETLG